MDDWSLLQQYVRDASQPAMEQLFRRHQDMVYAAACREVGNEHLAADITQAVFIVLMRRAGRIGPEVVLAGWLFNVMRFAAADARKSQSRRDHHEWEAAAMKVETRADANSQYDPRLIPVLNGAIASLPTSYRDAVVMKYLQGKSHIEVAAAQKITENAARQRLFRAIGKLRTKLSSKALATVGAGTVGVGTVEATLAAASAQATPSQVVAALQSALFSGPAQSSVATLATRTLRSMFMWNVKIAAVVCGTLLLFVLMSETLERVMAQQQNAVVAAAVVPASQPVQMADAAKFGPAKTPAQTVKAAFDAACAGDEKGFLSCFDQINVEDEKILKVTVHVISAADELRRQAAEKFGATVADNLFSATGVGIDGKDIAHFTESITGDQATVDIHAGPGKIPLVKVGDVWKITPTVLANLNRDGIQAQDQLAPEMRALAADVKADKFKTFEEFRDACAKRLKVAPGN